MRKISKDAAAAFMACRKFNRDNTEVRLTDFGSELFLHGNKIAILNNGALFISNAGWFSNVTKERLNALPCVSIYQKKFNWYLNGKKWDGGFISLSTWDLDSNAA